MSLAISKDRLRGLIAGLSGREVVVLGDPVLDVYLYGTTHRISREAPVLIVREDARESRLGGAGNAAANLTALGASVSFVGLTGDDLEANDLDRLFAERRVRTPGLIRMNGRHTVTKTRVLAGGAHTTKQQMLRIDRENDLPPLEEDRTRLVAAAEKAISSADALVVSHYGDGRLGDLYAAIAREARQKNKIVIVDSRFGLDAYKGVTAVTPNVPEAEMALGERLDDRTAAERGAEKLLERLDLESVILTRGRDGMTIAERGRASISIAAHGAKDAVDVTGAGDTVTATFTLALASGASTVEAAMLANCAASVVVQRVGAATLTPEELAETIEQLA
jgi:D-glycero-beta-D-manno-heptose-7-phosphate kinase